MPGVKGSRGQGPCSLEDYDHQSLAGQRRQSHHSPDEPDSSGEDTLRDRKLGRRANVDRIEKVGLGVGSRGVHVGLQVVLGILTRRKAAAADEVEAPRTPEPLPALAGRAPCPQHHTRSAALDSALQAACISVLIVSEHL